MKKTTRTWLEAEREYGSVQGTVRLLAKDALDSDAKKDAVIRDLKDRLRAVRGPQPKGYLDEAEAWERILKITDLRVKNWRKP